MGVGDEAEEEKKEEKGDKGAFSLVSPVGVMAVATPALLGDSRGSPNTSRCSETPPRLFFTWRSRLGLGLFGSGLLLCGDGVTVQDDFFC